MDERASGRMILIVLVLAVIALAVIMYGWQRAGASSAVEQTVDAFVPTGATFEQRLGHIDRAQAVADQINARQYEPPGRPR